ncbi:baseplate J/gp47 family protein [Peribacillus frigoritolerans]|uniref:baseplate J/gp47 family protein n=1 Tax=Peribacillus frigoritolerans TaxID=450367 RepID=UPI0025A1C8E5|nr:baseplate J/gp47 family protein [Peribacillus frigoritolerans]MDM5306351.1 baseplate J/gp47 family protein [Peribacillus frigoritolerans]
MAWGLSEKGFNRPNQADLKEEIDQKQKELFGEDVNLSYKSPNGIISGLLSWILAKVWELAEKVYHSGHPSEAEDKNLDYLTSYFLTSRNPELYAEGNVEFTGTPNYTVVAGTRFETETGVDYALKEDVLLNSSGIGTGSVVSLTAGLIGNTLPGTITVQSEPSASIETVINSEAITGGREKETDIELRKRLLDTNGIKGYSTPNSIVSAVQNVLGVRAANIHNNNTNVTVNGTPPNSYQVYVLGGNGQEIAEAIFDKGPAGIEPYGTSSFQVVDMSGVSHKVSYTPANTVNVYAGVDLTTDNTFQSTSITEVKDTIVRFIGGTVSDGSIYTGLNMGEKVIVQQLSFEVMQIQGVKDVVIKIGKTSGTLVSSNIAIAANEVVQTNATNIAVTVTV